MQKQYLNFINKVQSRSPQILLRRLIEKIIHKKLSNIRIVKAACSGNKGLEIGGPSRGFTVRGYCPVYSYAVQVDSVNFSNNTIWEGAIEEGFHFQCAPGKIGYQWIAEASNLEKIQTGSYDFLLSSNCLEHIANPLKAVEEWHRTVKSGGVLLFILPRKESNFDHRRSVTLFSHLLDDYRNDVQENDLTHLPEILQLHDLKRDPPAGNFDRFKKRSENNFYNRCLHHHVFDLNLLQKIITFFKMELLFKESSLLDHFIMARKM